MRIIVAVWLAVLSLHIMTVKTEVGVSVTFTPSPNPPNITVGGTAVFNCSSNHSTVTITWYLNKTVLASTLTSLGVIVDGAATPVSSLIIPGLVDPFNDTEVLCYASGPGFGDLSPPTVTLKVQGLPSEVGNLSCEQTHDDCIECNWEAPFSLTKIYDYDINITDITNSGETALSKSNSTTDKYCPRQYAQQYGEYEVSVAANNGAGMGAVSSDIVELKPNTTWGNVHILNDPTDKGHLNVTFNASTTSFLAGAYDIIAHFNEITNATGKADVDHEGKVNGNIRAGRLDERKWNMSISLEYDNIVVSEQVEINTIGVRGDLTVNGSRICVEIEFIDGSYIEECLVEYKCSDYHSRGSINIRRENPCGCTEDVSPNNYTVILYAGRFNESDKIFAVLDAIVMNDSVIAPSSSVILPSSSTVLPSSITPVNANETSFSTGLVIAVTLVPVVIVIVIAIVIIALLLAKKNNKVCGANKEKHEHADKEIAIAEKSIHNIVYLDTEVSTDRPRAPPTMEEQVQYTKVKSQGDALYSIAMPTTEDCSVAAQNVSENPNDSEYSHLNSRGYKSPHQPKLACNDTKEKEMYSTIPLAHGNMNKGLSYAVLLNYVAPHIGHKWEELGLALALTPDDIEQLKENHQGINDVFLFWEQQQTRPFTWETLIMALKSIDEHELVNRL